jgi:hypothetical protein
MCQLHYRSAEGTGRLSNVVAVALTLSWRTASSSLPILLKARPQQQRSTLLAGLILQAISKCANASPYFSCLIRI